MKVKILLTALIITAGQVVHAVEVTDNSAPLAAVTQESTVAQTTDSEPRTSIVNTMKEQANTLIDRTVSLLANPFVSEKDVDCMARNIFHEAANEPEEGKVAVGVVTINRALDPNYPNTICEVVKQKTAVTRTQTYTTSEEVKGGLFERTKTVTAKHTKNVQRAVCQFSWVCQSVKKPKTEDERWQEAQRIAQELADGGYEEYRAKYQDALYYHAVYVNPRWKLKRLTRTGNHIFYGPIQPKQVASN